MEQMEFAGNRRLLRSDCSPEKILEIEQALFRNRLQPLTEYFSEEGWRLNQNGQSLADKAPELLEMPPEILQLIIDYSDGEAINLAFSSSKALERHVGPLISKQVWTDLSKAQELARKIKSEIGNKIELADFCELYHGAMSIDTKFFRVKTLSNLIGLTSCLSIYLVDEEIDAAEIIESLMKEIATHGDNDARREADRRIAESIFSPLGRLESEKDLEP